MQLVAYGAQDIYLTGNPQITFFKVVYRRHTNFSMEAIEQTLDGTGSFGGSQTVTISRNGDLVGRMYVEFVPSDIYNTSFDVDGSSNNSNNVSAYLGNTLLNEIELEIGGQRIDKHYNHWLSVWQELTESNPTGKIAAYSAAGVESAVDGASALFQRMSYNHQAVTNASSWTAATPTKAWIPLQFWFCRNPGLALPLIALQYHEVKVKLTYCAQTDVTVDNSLAAVTDWSPSFSNMKLWVDYIYLDTDERRRFAQVSHEYLIEQVQFQEGSTNTTFTLNFNHPVKELIWTGIPIFADGVAANVNGTKIPRTVGGSTSTFQLILNGHDRFAARDLKYFTRTQVWQHHSGFGGTANTDSIYVYSFALKPEEHQPSGTCNFSRIDNAELRADVITGVGLRIYAVNYNVLRIMSGMGGLAYSN